MERRSGKYFGAGTTLRQISLATGGTLTLKRSVKSRCTRWVNPRSVYFLAQIAPKRGILHKKNQKKISGGDTPDSLSGTAGGGDPLPHPPQNGYTLCAGAQAPPLLGPRSRKPFPQIKIYHYTPADVPALLSRRGVPILNFVLTICACQLPLLLFSLFE